MKDGGEERTKKGPRKPAEPTPKQAADKDAPVRHEEPTCGTANRRYPQAAAMLGTDSPKRRVTDGLVPVAPIGSIDNHMRWSRDRAVNWVNTKPRGPLGQKRPAPKPPDGC